jgi:hypothetical protein
MVPREGRESAAIFLRSTAAGRDVACDHSPDRSAPISSKSWNAARAAPKNGTPRLPTMSRRASFIAGEKTCRPRRLEA